MIYLITSIVFGATNTEADGGIEWYFWVFFAIAVVAVISGFVRARGRK